MFGQLHQLTIYKIKHHQRLMDIAPDTQSVDKLFGSTTFYIDFYQRQYKWNEIPVNRLLDDIFHKFNSEYARNKELTPRKETITAKYSWYYLNTYVTNSIDGRIYVVDGQQRLTTLTLLLIKLRHLAIKFNSKLQGWVNNKIVGHSGYETEFWMFHEKHIATLNSLYEGVSSKEIDTSAGITSQNMVKNYEIISTWLDKQLVDAHKFETFTFYFNLRLVLINLNVEQTDVPMVFEVINDRGVKLKPYEILKGKLLGQIDKIELDKFKLNDLWENQVNQLNDMVQDVIDDFFVQFFKAKLVNSRAAGRRFDNNYHREMFEEDIDVILKLKDNPAQVKTFLLNDFKYFTDLYERFLKAYREYDSTQPFAHYNRLNELDSIFILILSGCMINDKDEAIKIYTITYEFDRLFCLLQLQGAYDSNSFNEVLYAISPQIRDQHHETYRKIFDAFLIDEINTKRGTQTEETFTYSYFKDTGNGLNPRFKRYFFGRVEEFIATNTNVNLKHSLNDLVTKTGAVNGFHIEHILSYNPENLEHFENDEERFERERNRLGALLLLKGKDNISSKNEKYAKKLKSYAGTLYWNETLRADTYTKKLDFQHMMHSFSLNFRPLDVFGMTEVEERHKLLFEISKLIWK